MSSLARTIALAPPQAGRERLYFLQYLRGITALLVVFSHLAAPREGFFAPFGHTDFGRAGVLVFFVLSGFIMGSVARDEPPLRFALRRVIRVVPLYWILSLVYYALLFHVDFTPDAPREQVPDLVASLLFLPHYNHGVPDQIWPVLVPGWTLNYEMFFYALFALGLASGRAVMATGTVLIALVALGVAAEPSDPRLITWTSPLLLMFLAGMALSVLRDRVSLAPLAPLMLPAVLMLTWSSMFWTPPGWTAPVMALGAILTVAAALGCDARWPGWRSRGLQFLGDASYSIYLSHTIVLLGFVPLVRALPLEGWAQFAFVTVAGCAASATVGGLVYLWVERPVIAALRRRWG